MSLLSRAGFLLRRELSTRLAARRRRRGRRRTGRAAGADATADPATSAEPQTRSDASAGAHETPPAQDPTLASFYANLELPYGADADAVSEARRRLLRRYHPDLHSSDPERKRTATQVAQGLNRAHDELVSRLARKQQ